jgi:hypothetical protein
MPLRFLAKLERVRGEAFAERPFQNLVEFVGIVVCEITNDRIPFAEVPDKF